MGANERAVWVRERLAARSALDDAEEQIAQLKAELEAARRETGGGPRGLVNGEVDDFQQHKVLITGPPLPELSPRIVNTSGYIAFLFHFVVK